MLGGISKVIDDRFAVAEATGRALTESNGHTCVVGEERGVTIIAFPDRPKYPPSDARSMHIVDIKTLIPSKMDLFKNMLNQDVPRWAYMPTLSQLALSCHQLMQLRNENGWERVAILRPSYPLPFDEVKDCMQNILDERFALITKE